MAKYSGVPKPRQGDKDEVPSGLGFATPAELGETLTVDEKAPLPRKAGLPVIEARGTFNMCNSMDDVADPY